MAAGVQRVLSKCQKCVEAGNFYEAHQMYRTLYFRYSGAKKYEEAIDLLYSGSQTLLQHKQTTSGADLALLMVDVLSTSNTAVTDELTDKVVNILRMMDSSSQDRHQYLNNALRWTIKVQPEHKAGHPELHQKCGLLFWQERNYSQARYHYLHSSDGKNLAIMLIEYHTTLGYPSEVDLFIAQTVLQFCPQTAAAPDVLTKVMWESSSVAWEECCAKYLFLCLQNKDTAHVVFVTYTKQHPAGLQGPPYIQPLLNFIWFLLLALEGGKLPVFSVLCEKYQDSISRDPSYRDYLDKIGQIFFGLPPPKSQSQGFLGNLFQSLLDGGDERQDNSQKGSKTPQTPSVESKDVSPVELD